MSTKPKPSTISSTSAAASAAESERAERAETARTALADARSAVASAEATVSAATARADALTARLSAGDDTVTTEMFSLGTANVGRATILRDAAVAEATRAERMQVSTDTSLAEVVAAVVADTLPGVEVLSVSGPVSVEAEEPVCLVRQATPPTLNLVTGSMAGRVEVQLHRRAYHRELDADAIERRVNDTRGLTAKVRNVVTIERGGRHLDTLQVLVTHGTAVVPVIGHEGVSSAANRGASDAVLHATADLFASDTDAEYGVVVGRSPGQRVPAVEVHAETAQHLTRSLTTPSGRREHILSVSLRVTPNMHPRARRVTGAEVQRHLSARLPDALSTRMVTQLGRITSATVDAFAPMTADQYSATGRVCTVSLTVVSQVPPA